MPKHDVGRPGPIKGGDSHGATGHDRTSTVAHAIRTRPHSATTRPTPTPTAPKRGRHNYIDGGAGCVRRHENTVVDRPNPQRAGTHKSKRDPGPTAHSFGTTRRRTGGLRSDQ